MKTKRQRIIFVNTILAFVLVGVLSYTYTKIGNLILYLIIGPLLPAVIVSVLNKILKWIEDGE